MPVLVQIYPDRLRRGAVDEPERIALRADRSACSFLVGKGLRAQLRTGNLLTGQLYVALDFFPKAPAAKIDSARTRSSCRRCPTASTRSSRRSARSRASSTRCPFEQIGADLRKTLATLNKTLGSAEQLASRLNNDVAPEMTAAMKDVRKTLNTADRTLGSAERAVAEDAPLQQDLRQTLQELTRAAGSLRVLTDYLERHPESLMRGKPEDKKK